LTVALGSKIGVQSAQFLMNLDPEFPNNNGEMKALML
jgi:hypothetical protein